MTTHIGWVCNSCGKEVREWITSVSSASGGGLATASFEHVTKSKCDAQRATVRRISGRTP